MWSTDRIASRHSFHTELNNMGRRRSTGPATMKSPVHTVGHYAVACNCAGSQTYDPRRSDLVGCIIGPFPVIGHGVQTQHSSIHASSIEFAPRTQPHALVTTTENGLIKVGSRLLANAHTKLFIHSCRSIGTGPPCISFAVHRLERSAIKDQ